MRRLATISVLVLVSTFVATIAAAGGGHWHLDREESRPGDHVEASSSVAWGQMGKPQDGPYFVYLAPMKLEVAWLEIPEDAWLVGLVEVREGPHWEGEYLVGPHHAIAKFEIPDIGPGRYQILHCNDPCTTILGDIVGGMELRVLPGSKGRAPDVIAAEVRESAKYLPLFYPDYPSTTIPEEFRAEPALHPDLANPSDAIRPHLMVGSETPPSDPGSTRTATVDHLLVEDAPTSPEPVPISVPEPPRNGPALLLSAAVVASVLAMAWVALSRFRRSHREIEWNLDDLEGVSAEKNRVEVLR